MNDDNELLDAKTAALRAHLDVKYLLRLSRTPGGPRSVRPSPKRAFFWRNDIDSWIASWKTQNDHPTA